MLIPKENWFSEDALPSFPPKYIQYHVYPLSVCFPTLSSISSSSYRPFLPFYSLQSSFFLNLPPSLLPPTLSLWHCVFILPSSTTPSFPHPSLPPSSPSLRTCGDEEDAGAEDDVVAWLVELAGGDTQPPHEEQDHTQDREDTGGSYSAWTHTHQGKNNCHYHNEHMVKILLLLHIVRQLNDQMIDDMDYYNTLIWRKLVPPFFLLTLLFPFYLYQRSLLQSVRLLPSGPSPSLYHFISLTLRVSLSSFPPLSVCPSAVCLFALCMTDLLIGLRVVMVLPWSRSSIWFLRRPMSHSWTFGGFHAIF